MRSEETEFNIIARGIGGDAEEAKSKDITSKNLLKEKALTFTRAVTLVGLNHATDENSSRFRRIIWIVWIVFGFGLAVYQMQDRIAEYQSYPFDTKFQVKNVPEIEFPQITICKQNSLTKSKLKNLGLYEIIENFRDVYTSEQKNGSNTSDERIASDLLHNATLQWEEILKNLTQSWDDVVDAIWGRETVYPKEVKTDLGYCAALSTVNHTLISTEGGLRAGLKLFLKSEESDFVQPLSTDQDALTGYRILIHDPLEIPLLSDAGFSLPFGSAAQIQISFENITHLGPPYGDCNEDPNYKFVNCMTERYRSLVVKALGCKLLYMSGDEQVCSYLQHRFLHLLLEYFDITAISDFQISCSQQCHRRLYKYSATQSKLSKVFFKEMTKSLNPFDDVNATVLYVYYPYLMYKEIRSVPSYSFFSLLCDLGGALSLLLGATLLTVYEVGEFVFLIIRDYFRYRLLEKSDLV